MNFWLAFLAGLSAKFYDDIKDNVNLKQFKNRDVLEISKLFHMGAFMNVTFYNPLYFYIIGIVVLFNIIGDRSCYKFVYERCLFIAMLLFLPFFDNSKIQFPATSIYLSILFVILVSCIGAYIEATIIKEEYSYRKLFCRICGLLWSIFLYYHFLPVYEIISLIQMYVIGYLFFSILVQIYSLFICEPEIKIKTKSKHPKIKKSKMKKSKIDKK
jgi:hypothetical protein